MILILSIVASIIIWGLLSSWKFALVLVGSIFIHEYGHYYWMGREGIKDRDMFFIPPFGAVARSKEMWPTRGSESRIALAGPAFGLISVLIFFIFWFVSSFPIFAASVIVASYINLFNLLLPIAILDGGRVMKSILFSINKSLGKSFYLFGFVFLAILMLTDMASPILAFIIGYLLWQEYSSYLAAEKKLTWLDDVLVSVEKLEINFSNEELKRVAAVSWGYQNINAMKEHKEQLNWFLCPPPMSSREIELSLLLFLIISLIYIFAIIIMGNYIDTSLYSLQNYFK